MSKDIIANRDYVGCLIAETVAPVVCPVCPESVSVSVHLVKTSADERAARSGTGPFFCQKCAVISLVNVQQSE